jgi:hypothetical protein
MFQYSPEEAAGEAPAGTMTKFTEENFDATPCRF